MLCALMAALAAEAANAAEAASAEAGSAMAADLADCSAKSAAYDAAAIRRAESAPEEIRACRADSLLQNLTNSWVVITT